MARSPMIRLKPGEACATPTWKRGPRFMIESVNSEAYAKATGTMLDSYLTASGPFREMLEKTMLRALRATQHADAR